MYDQPFTPSLPPSRKSKGKFKENSCAELGAQTMLASLYQQQNKEGGSKTEDLAGAAKELQGLLKDYMPSYSR